MLVTKASPGMLEPMVTRALAEVDPNLTLTSIRSMQQQVELTFDEERAVAGLAGLFGVVALLLAAVGLYGVTAYNVGRRTSEIGVRLALGATPAQGAALIIRGAFALVAIGLVVGLPLALAAGQFLRSQLYGLNPYDPAAILLAIGTLSFSTLVAALVPALRASCISPSEALRAE